MRKNKFIAIALAATFALSLTSCGSKSAEAYKKAIDDMDFVEVDSFEDVDIKVAQDGYVYETKDSDSVLKQINTYVVPSKFNDTLDELDEVICAGIHGNDDDGSSNFVAMVIDFGDKDEAKDFFDELYAIYKDRSENKGSQIVKNQSKLSKNSITVAIESADKNTDKSVIMVTEVQLDGNEVVLINYYQVADGVKDVKKAYEEYYQKVNTKSPLEML